MRFSPTTDRGLARAEHQGNVGAVDVGVEQPDFVAHARERDGEIDGQRGLADAAFAGPDGDDAVDAGQGLRLGHGLPGHVRMRAHVCVPDVIRMISAQTLIIRRVCRSPLAVVARLPFTNRYSQRWSETRLCYVC